MSEIHPLDDRIVVSVDEKEDMTPGGIILPDSGKKKPQTGTVLRVGRGRITEHGVLVEPIVGPGDRVIFHRYAGTEVTVDGEDVQIMKESEILAVVKEG